MLLASPIVVLALVVIAVLKKTPVLGIDLNVVIAIVIPFVPKVARVLRAAALGIVRLSYVDAARAAGYSAPRIIFRHILPNVMAPYLILLTAFIGQAIRHCHANGRNLRLPPLLEGLEPSLATGEVVADGPVLAPVPADRDRALQPDLGDVVDDLAEDPTLAHARVQHPDVFRRGILPP